ncbi:MAG: transporter substrate-binding protein, partial [Cyanobium sp. LacPavin_0920_WC12_MAG_63_22]|nr:transporter substrate-binding protein [Cyanobium sp. LacPavin_0920_WC12_MAG_63_22]
MKSSLMRKTTMRYVAGATAMAASLSLVACGGGGEKASGDFDGEVKVGILHSRSGTMAISENTVAEAELMAIEEINAKGGITIDGKKLKIVPVEEDGASDWPTFAEKAKKLIDQDQVAVVFGGWTSASRKAMLPVFEAKDHFLFYPIQYEGQECSKNIFYSGATPNQQAEPA